MKKYEIDEKIQEELFKFLAHGDDGHKDWLREAIKAFFEGKPRPEVR